MQLFIVSLRCAVVLLFLSITGNIKLHAQCAAHASFTYTTQAFNHANQDTISVQNNSSSTSGVFRSTWYVSHLSGGNWVVITGSNQPGPVFYVVSSPGDTLFRVCLTVTDSLGCSDSACQIVSLGGCNISASFYTVNTGSAILTYNTTSSNWPYTSYWSFQGGVPSSSTLNNATTSYLQPGTYQVCLVVRSSNGCSDSICHSVTVSTCGLHAGYWYSLINSSPLNPDTVLLNNTSTLPGFISSYDLNVYNSGGTLLSSSSSATFPASLIIPNDTLRRVCLVVHDSAHTCVDSMCKNILSISNCYATARFSAWLDTSGRLVMNNYSGGGPSFTSYWSFPGGTPSSSTATNPTVTYAVSGPHQICLIVRTPGSAACMDSVCHTVQYCPLHAGYNYNLLNANATNPDTVLFVNISTQLSFINSYDLNVYSSGGVRLSGSSGLFTPSIIIPSDTLRKVCLVIHDSSRTCIDSFCENIFSLGGCTRPHAAFSTTVDSTRNIVMHNSSVGLPSFSSSWTFPGGTPSTSTASNPVVSYAASGTYRICLVISTAGGCVDSICNNVIVNNCNLHAGYTYTLQNAVITNPDTVIFQNTSTPLSLINIYDLHVYNSGGILLSSSSSATFPASLIIPSDTLRKVCLVVHDSARTCIDSLCQNILSARGCAAHAAFFTSADSNSNITMHNTSTGTPSFTSSWTFAGGTPSSSTATNPVVSYASNGTYSVCLVVRSPAGCADSICQNVVVNRCNLHAGYTYTLQNAVITNPDTVIFQNASTPLSLIKTYDLHVYNSGGILLSSSSSATFPASLIIPSDTLRKVCLVVHDSARTCIDSLCQNILSARGCAAHAAFFTSADSNSNITMHNTSTGTPSFTSSWTFAGGTPSSSTATNPVVSYASNGTYSVCLVVRSPAGCADSICQNVVVNRCNLHAGYTYTLQNAVITNPDTVIFQNASTPLSLIKTYDLHVYNSGGILLSSSSSATFPASLIIPNDTLRRVCLVVHDSARTCIDSNCQNIMSSPCSITASFYTVNTGSAILTYNTTSSNLSYTSSWSFPGGVPTSSTQANASTTYPHPGTYQICLVVRSSGGCSDSICHSVTISCGLHAGYSVTLVNSDPTNPDTVLLTNTSQPLNLISYNLNVYNSGGTLLSSSSSATFPSSLIIPDDTLRRICLVVHDSAHTCVDTSCQNILSQAPCRLVASFYTTTTGSAVLCYNTSTGSLPYNSYWSFPGGSPSGSGVTNPTVNYSSTGSHLICLTVIDSHGCQDSTCRSASTSPPPAPQGYGEKMAGNSDASDGKDREVSILVKPNPFSSFTVIEIAGAGTEEIELRVYDLAGKVVRTERQYGNAFHFDKERLPAGMYMFDLRQSNRTIGNGKLMVE